MPRRSAAALAVRPPPRIRADVARLSPGPTLSVPERAVWLATVQALPATYFGPEQAALLDRYARHIVRANCIEALILATDPGAQLSRYAALVRLAGEESGRILALARAMRLTNQSRIHATAAGASAAKRKPGRDIALLLEPKP